MKYFTAAVTALLISTSPPVWAHSEFKHAPAKKSAISTEEKTFGKEGDPKQSVRTIPVDMSDKMRFTPATVSVKQGETIKFVVKNSGKIMHEFVLGTMSELKEHSAVMQRFPGMDHFEPYMAHVAPGKTETIAWQFTKAGDFNFGCLIPGHFEASMVGNVTVK